MIAEIGGRARQGRAGSLHGSMWVAMSTASVAGACAAFARADGYERRRPEETLLYQLVSGHWPAFLERADESGGLPRFVVRDVEEYLRCGILEHGFVQLARRRSGHEMLAAFSCSAAASVLRASSARPGQLSLAFG